MPTDWRIPACAPEATWTVRLTAHDGDADESAHFTPLVDELQGYGPSPAFATPAKVTIRRRR